MANSSYVSHIGPLDSSTRASPTLAFFEKYASQVDSMDLSAPFHAWYAPTAQFYNADGVVYDGGDAIWTWMHALFGQFEKVQHDIKIIRLLPSVSKDESKTEKSGDLVLSDCVTTFWMKPPLNGDGITVPRMLSFLIGEAEVKGQGTDGLQILEAKAWWDSNVLVKEVLRRKNAKMNEQ
jgi:hypothetical protein